jgi:hypothetical protein
MYCIIIDIFSLNAKRQTVNRIIEHWLSDNMSKWNIYYTLKLIVELTVQGLQADFKSQVKARQYSY